MSLRKILLDGKIAFDVQVGIISRIQYDSYLVLEIDTEYGGIYKGDIFALENTYCRDVVSKKQTLTFDDVSEIKEMLKHPVYLSTQLRAYIGTPIFLDNQVWGTLNFTSRQPKYPEFSQRDYRIIESLASQTSELLANETNSAHSKQTNFAITK